MDRCLSQSLDSAVSEARKRQQQQRQQSNGSVASFETENTGRSNKSGQFKGVSVRQRGLLLEMERRAKEAGSTSTSPRSDDDASDSQPLPGGHRAGAVLESRERIQRGQDVLNNLMAGDGSMKGDGTQGGRALSPSSPIPNTCLPFPDLSLSHLLILAHKFHLYPMQADRCTSSCFLLILPFFFDL